MLFWEGMRVHKGYSYYDALKRMETVFTVTERFFHEYKFDFSFLDTIVPNMQGMFLLAVFEKHNKPFYYLFSSRIPGRFVVIRGLKDRHFHVEKAFIEIKNRELSDEERGLADRFLEDFKSDKGASRIEDKKVKKRSLFDTGRIKRGFFSVWEGYRFKIWKGAYRRISIFGPLQYIINRLMADIKAKVYKNLQLFENPDYNEKYMIFFLHRQPETSTFVRAPFFLNQHAIIENIAKSLPIDVLLYVKPHYNSFGGKPIKYYEDFLCRPNVRLTKVDANGKDLVRNSLGVINITGTVGWEGLLLGKPVISLGNAFYNMFDQVMKVTDLTQLPEKIDFALHKYKPDEEMLKKFIVAMYQGSDKGYAFPPPLSKIVLTGENIQNIVDGLEREGVFSRGGQ